MSITLGTMKAEVRVVGILALVIPLTLFVALMWLHEPKIAFRGVSIVSQSR